MAGSGYGEFTRHVPERSAGETLIKLRAQLRSWDVWETVSTHAATSYSACPSRAEQAVLIETDPAILIAKCREYEADLQAHIDALQRLIEKEALTATRDRMRVLQALQTAHVNMRAALTIRNNPHMVIM